MSVFSRPNEGGGFSRPPVGGLLISVQVHVIGKPATICSRPQRFVSQECQVNFLYGISSGRTCKLSPPKESGVTWVTASTGNDPYK